MYMSKFHIYITKLLNRQRPEVLAIERSTSANPWDEEKLRGLEEKGCTIMVAMTEEADRFRVVGYCVFDIEKGTRQQTVRLKKLAVAPEFQRQGIGTQILDKLKASPLADTEIHAPVGKREAGALSFLKKNGFKAEGVVPGFCEETGDEVCVM